MAASRESDCVTAECLYLCFFLFSPEGGVVLTANLGPEGVNYRTFAKDQMPADTAVTIQRMVADLEHVLEKYKDVGLRVRAEFFPKGEPEEKRQARRRYQPYEKKEQERHDDLSNTSEAQQKTNQPQGNSRVRSFKTRRQWASDEESWPDDDDKRQVQKN